MNEWMNGWMDRKSRWIELDGIFTIFDEVYMIGPIFEDKG